MSHSPHGECDVESQGTDETTGSQQLAGRAHDAGSGGHAAGCQHSAHQTPAGGLPGEGSCRSCPRPPGSQTPNATPESVAYDADHLARTRYSGTNHTHLSELLNEREGIDIGRTTLRRILVNAGLKSPQRRRPPKHRVRRQRMPRQGMLIQMDGSYHPWLGDQVPPFTLLIAVDDATGTVANALFCEKEEAYTYFLLIQDLVQSVGIPIALYVDRHGVFRHTPGSGLPGTATQFSRAMDELGIQMIFALSPQAKGRGGLREPSRTGAGYRTPFGGRQQHQGSQWGAGAVSTTIQPALPGSPAML